MDGKNKTDQQYEDQGSKGGQAGESNDQQQYEDQDALIEQNETDNLEDTGRGIANR